MKGVQSACGATAHAVTKVMVLVQDECDKIAATAKDYRDPSIVIEDARTEVAEVLDAVKAKLLNSHAKILAEAVKISAWQFNQLVMMRRYYFGFLFHKPLIIFGYVGVNTSSRLLKPRMQELCARN